MSFLVPSMPTSRYNFVCNIVKTKLYKQRRNHIIYIVYECFELKSIEWYSHLDIKIFFMTTFFVSYLLLGYHLNAVQKRENHARKACFNARRANKLIKKRSLVCISIFLCEFIFMFLLCCTCCASCTCFYKV